MSRFLVAVAFVALSSAAGAAPVAPESAALCASQGSLAHSIMASRQDGARMSEMISHAQKIENPLVAESYQVLVRMAFLMDRERIPALQQRAAEDFENEVYSLCLERVAPAG